ncbi:hypothetical protein ACP70R_003244 [Stipagrostis hirtigluma subsp. patula]
MEKGKKLTKGRQKIEIKPIQNEEARQVCFSKRRANLFKKASEISTLCGGEVAIVIFSPGGKSFSFGHPSVCSVVDRFFNVPTLYGHAAGDVSQGSDGVKDRLHEMNNQLAELQRSMEAEKQRKERVQKVVEKESGGFVMQWLNDEVSASGLEELEELQKKLTAVQGMVNWKLDQVLQDAKKTRKPPPQPHMHMALASSVLLHGQRGRPMFESLPTSSRRAREGFHVNSGLSDSLGANYFNDQFGGNYFNGQFGG